jgi:uncharacterized protein YqjF (DUF2071 family)
VVLSLDADRLAVVVGARLAFGLPYRWARMSHHPDDNTHTYAAQLRRAGRPVSSRVVVRVGAQRQSTELDHFLSARWGLHVHWWGRTLYVPNRHEAWPVHDTELLELDDGLVAVAGFPGLTSRPPDHLGFSPGVQTVFGLPGNASDPRRP